MGVTPILQEPLMPIEILIAVLVVAFACAGVIVYALVDNGKEAPEPIETDVEHDSAGNKLSKSDPRYWLAVLVEGLFSYPAAALRRLFGLPQK